MSDERKPKPTPADVKVPGAPTPKEPSRTAQRLPPPALDFDPDELIDSAFEALESVGRHETPLGHTKDATEEPDPTPIVAPAALDAEGEPEPTRALGTLAPSEEEPARTLLPPSEPEPLTARGLPSGGTPTTTVEDVHTDVTASSGPASDEAALTVELDYEADFADAEDILFAEDLAKKWANRPPEAPSARRRPAESKSLVETKAQSFAARPAGASGAPAQSAAPRASVARATSRSPRPRLPSDQGSGSAAMLGRQGTRAEWEARATWLEQEAQAARDPHAQARSYLVASELWAMTGHAQRAEDCAATAHRLWGSLALAARQVRWLRARHRDWEGVSAALEPETRAAPTPEARVHAANFHADVLALGLGDVAQAKRKTELAARAKPDDVRAHIARLVDHLGESAGAPRMLWPKDDPSPNLRAAAELAAALRDGPIEKVETGDPGLRAALEFERARRHVLDGEIDELAASVGRIAQALPELTDAGAWLAAALLGLNSSTRARAVDTLDGLAAKSSDAGTLKALLRRSVEQGDLDRTGLLLSRADLSLGALDRVAIEALTGKVAATTLDTLGADLPGPLAVALRGAALERTAPRAEATPEGRYDFAVGSELGRAAAQYAEGHVAPLEAALAAYREQAQEGPLTKVLELELAHTKRDGGAVARRVADWPANDAEAQKLARDRHAAAAFFYERDNDAEAAVREYSQAHAVDPADEALARALIDYGGDRQRLLGAVAQNCEGDLQAALLSLEVASAVHLDPAEIDTLLARAADHPLVAAMAHHVGEWHARHSRDKQRVLGWLQARREDADDPTERAMALVREARVLAPSEPTLAAALLEESGQLKPEDSALRRLYELANPDLAGETRAAWREHAAQKSRGVTAQWHYLEAAFEYERLENFPELARSCRQALELGPSEIAEAMLDRARGSGDAAAELAEEILSQARRSEDPDEQLELYERLSALDLARGDRASARLWQSAILEKNPEHLPALRHIEHAYIGAGRLDELEPSALVLARLPDRAEANAHAWLAQRIQVNKTGAANKELADRVLDRGDPPIWALRYRLELARAEGDLPKLHELYEILVKEAPTKEDVATLSLRAADAAAAQRDLEGAAALISQALDACPEHPVALDRRAELLFALNKKEAAAETLETLARHSVVDIHAAEAWFQAAETWLATAPTLSDEPSRAKAREVAARARNAFEQAIAKNPRHAGAFAQLQALYQEAGEQRRLADLLEAQLLQTAEPSERVALEIARAQALSDVEDPEGALECLSRALEIQPDHMDALDLFADTSYAVEHWEDAEQAWVSLARHLTDPAAQAETYRRLARLYETRLPNLERAELACKEVLKRAPDDVDACEILVRVYSERWEADKAIQIQTQLFKAATSEELRRDRVLELARLFEDVAKQPQRAKQTYEQAHKVWPHDCKVLKAAAEYFTRTGDSATRHFLLDRAANDARRALGSGRFSAGYFELLATVAELRGDTDTAHVTRATLAAILGDQAAPPAGAGAKAGDPTLDEGMAPELLSPALRALIQHAGGYLDAAYPVDLAELPVVATARSNPAFNERVVALAQAFGVMGLEVLVASSAEVSCIPIGSSPPRLVCSRRLVELSDPDVADFFLVRSLKILQAHAATLIRTPASDLGAMVAGWLEALAPNYHPDVADRARVEEHSRRISKVIAGRLDPNNTTLAIEVSHALGPRTGQLAMAVQRWGNRVALLAVGNPASAFQALALASGLAEGLPQDAEERLRWITRNPDARNLAVFGVGPRYAEERQKLGLGPKPSAQPAAKPAPAAAALPREGREEPPGALEADAHGPTSQSGKTARTSSTPSVPDHDSPEPLEIDAEPIPQEAVAPEHLVPDAGAESPEPPLADEGAEVARGDGLAEGSSTETAGVDDAESPNEAVFELSRERIPDLTLDAPSEPPPGELGDEPSAEESPPIGLVEPAVSESHPPPVAPVDASLSPVAAALAEEPELAADEALAPGAGEALVAAGEPEPASEPVAPESASPPEPTLVAEPAPVSERVASEGGSLSAPPETAEPEMPESTSPSDPAPAAEPRPSSDPDPSRGAAPEATAEADAEVPETADTEGGTSPADSESSTESNEDSDDR